MVLALPPCPPVDPDDVNILNSTNIQPISFKFYMRLDTPLRYFAIEIFADDTCIPKIFELQYLHE